MISAVIIISYYVGGREKQANWTKPLLPSGLVLILCSFTWDAGVIRIYNRTIGSYLVGNVVRENVNDLTSSN